MTLLKDILLVLKHSSRSIIMKNDQKSDSKYYSPVVSVGTLCIMQMDSYIKLPKANNNCDLEV